MNRSLPLIAALVAASPCALLAREDTSSGQAAGQETDLAKQLANPIAALISFPIQSKYDFGIGPTAVALKQSGPRTVGALANHIWSFAGEDSREDVNATFLQPFVSYITETKITFSVNLETTYDWEHGEWKVPVNFVVSQLVKIGGQPVQFFGGLFYFDGPDGGPEWVRPDLPVSEILIPCLPS